MVERPDRDDRGLLLRRGAVVCGDDGEHAPEVHRADGRLLGPVLRPRAAAGRGLPDLFLRVVHHASRVRSSTSRSCAARPRPGTSPWRPSTRPSASTCPTGRTSSATRRTTTSGATSASAEKYGSIDVPALNVGGWSSPWELQGVLTNFVGLVNGARSAEARRRQKLVIGPWTHQLNRSRRVGEFEYGPRRSSTSTASRCGGSIAGSRRSPTASRTSRPYASS